MKYSIYKPGKTNATADAMSRNPTHWDNPATLLALTVPTFLIIEDIKKEQAATQEIKELSQDAQDWEIKDREYLFNGKIYIPNQSTLKTTLLKEFHNSPAEGHEAYIRQS